MKVLDLAKKDPAHVYGIDASVYQGDNIDWIKVKKSGVSFVFCKASEGVTVQDKHFKDNYCRSQDSGLLVGAYHFFRGGRTGKDQAGNFCNMVGDLFEVTHLPPVIDVEAVDAKVPLDTQITYVLDWCKEIEDSFNVKPVIYTSLRVLRDLFKNTTKFKNMPLWTVDYRLSVSTPKIPVGFSSWKFWQFTDKGEVDGIKNSVDVNKFNGNFAELQKFLNQSHLQEG
jgi:lysozyme